jgi:hypothetical protein
MAPACRKSRPIPAAQTEKQQIPEFEPSRNIGGRGTDLKDAGLISVNVAPAAGK